MAVKLVFDERKWLLKCFWEMGNAIQVQWLWRVEFCSPTTRVIITRIRDKFEVDRTVQDLLKARCGRKRSSTDNENDVAVMQVLARSSKTSLMQCSREIGNEKPSVHRMRAHKWKPYISKLAHALNDDDPDRWLQFCEWFLHKCDEKENVKTQLFGQMKPHLILMSQLIGIIMCTGLTKTQTLFKKIPSIFQE